MTPAVDRRRTTRWRGRPDEDRGAALVVAIGFVLMIGAITAGLSSLVTSSMNNRITLTALRDREYAADAAIEDAITDVRSRIDDGRSSCAGPGGTSTSTVNRTAIRVDWRPVCAALLSAEGLAVVQHDVAFTACPDLGTACAPEHTLLRAQVAFQRGDGGRVDHTVVQSWSVHR